MLAWGHRRGDDQLQPHGRRAIARSAFAERRDLACRPPRGAVHGLHCAPCLPDRSPRETAGASSARPLLEELAGWLLDGLGQPFHRRDPRVSFPRLDPADLGGVDATAGSDLLLAEAEPLAGGEQICAKTTD